MGTSTLVFTVQRWNQRSVNMSIIAATACALISMVTFRTSRTAAMANAARNSGMIQGYIEIYDS
jgi:hypothetical protein